MKVYFAKSNKCNPDNVMRVRSMLQSLDCEVLEFTGGTYSDKDLVESEKLVILPDTMLSKDSARIGKGLYNQIETFGKTNGKDNILICYLITSTDVLVSRFVKTEVDNPTNWTDHGKVFFREEPVSITKFIFRKTEEML